eukprot:TRINITY_DN3241_c0_g1_i1.p1 TRINITY_DN3241_c0_g1~~TRINITY_DN3241_c0_g1_i1.p1  ORF type:complete len:222 (+),score=45.41 TRINITY_DN3241_c0_g1_i1:193-858(+)
MKIKTIARSEEDFTRERPRDTLKVHRNLDPALHPFERAREYTRAVNAVKLNKVFAKPFVHAFDGHKDGISAIAINKKSLKSFVSGAHDGEIRVWDISERQTMCQHRRAHTGAVRGIAVHPNGQSFVSCGTDQTIKVWRLGGLDEGTMGGQEPDNSNALVQTMMGEDCYSMVDHSWDCLLYTSDAADEEDSVDLGGRRIIKKKKTEKSATKQRAIVTRSSIS